MIEAQPLPAADFAGNAVRPGRTEFGRLVASRMGAGCRFGALDPAVEARPSYGTALIQRAFILGVGWSAKPVWV
ncbi:MAG: hypothetical protein ACRYG4_02740 [Janthinobacterium lividum]